MDDFETLLITLEPRIGAAGMAAMRNIRKELQLTQDEANQTAKYLGLTIPDAIDKLSRSSKGATVGLNSLRQNLSQVAISAAGVSGPIGRVVESLLLLGAGSGAVTAVAAGIAVIGAAMRALGEDSKAADEAVQALTKSFAQATGSTLQSTIDSAVKKLDELKAERKELEEQIKAHAGAGDIGAVARAAQAEFAGSDADQAAQATSQLNTLKTKLDAVTFAIGLGEAEMKDFLRTVADAGDHAGDTLEATERKLAALQERARSASLAASQGLAELAGDPLGKKIADLDAMISNIQKTQHDLGANAPEQLQPWIAKLEQVRTLAASVQKSFTVIVEALPNEPLPGQAGIAPIQRGTGNLAAPNRPNTGEIEDEKTRLVLLQQQQRVLAEQSDAIGDAARGALQLADAFGAVGSRTATILEDIITIATKIPDLVKGIQVLSAGGGVAGAISGGLAVLGALASLIGTLFGGTSPEEQARQEALQKNSEQLAHLSLVVGNLANGITGSQQAKVEGFLDKALHSGTGLDRFVLANTPIGAARLDPGLKADIVAVANALNIDLTQSLSDLDKAIKANEIGRLVDTFEGASRVTQARLTLNDVKTPQGILAAAIQDAARFSPALKPLTGLDLTTTAGRESATDLLKRILDALTSGKGVPDTLLGDLTADQLLGAVTNLGDLLNQANAQGQVGGQTEQFGVSQTITVAQASEILAFLSTANVFAEQTAQNTAIANVLLTEISAAVGGVSAVPGTAAASRVQGDYAQARSLALGNVRIA